MAGRRSPGALCDRGHSDRRLLALLQQTGGTDRQGGTSMRIAQGAERINFYAAFISYSHAKDKPIATALQSAIQRQDLVSAARSAHISGRHEPFSYTTFMERYRTSSRTITILYTSSVIRSC
jgi:hypothetical protein